MATLATLRNVVASKIGLDNSASSAEQTLIDEWINQGVLDVVLKTRCNVDSDTMTTTADIADYDLDTDILQILDMYITSDSDDYSLSRVTPTELIDMRRRSGDSATPPVRYYALAGSNRLMLYPTPDAADTITIFYVPRPTTLSSSSDTPSEIPAEYHKAVEYYALAQAADYADDGSSQMGLTYQAQYEKMIRDIRRYQGRKGGLRNAPARVNMRRRRRVAHDPSQDLGF